MRSPGKSIDNQCTGFVNGWWLPCCVGHDYVVADAIYHRSFKAWLKASPRLGRCVYRYTIKKYGYGMPTIIVGGVIGGLMAIGTAAWGVLRHVTTGNLLHWR